MLPQLEKFKVWNCQAFCGCPFFFFFLSATVKLLNILKHLIPWRVFYTTQIYDPQSWPCFKDIPSNFCLIRFTTVGTVRAIKCHNLKFSGFTIIWIFLNQVTACSNSFFKINKKSFVFLAVTDVVLSPAKFRRTYVILLLSVDHLEIYWGILELGYGSFGYSENHRKRFTKKVVHCYLLFLAFKIRLCKIYYFGTKTMCKIVLFKRHTEHRKTHYESVCLELLIKWFYFRVFNWSYQNVVDVIVFSYVAIYLR